MGGIHVVVVDKCQQVLSSPLHSMQWPIENETSAIQYCSVKSLLAPLSLTATRSKSHVIPNGQLFPSTSQHNHLAPTATVAPASFRTCLRFVHPFAQCLTPPSFKTQWPCDQEVQNPLLSHMSSSSDFMHNLVIE